MDFKDDMAGRRFPAMGIRVEFYDGEPWEYRLALNGRHVKSVHVDGVRYVPCPERDWDSEVTE